MASNHKATRCHNHEFHKQKCLLSSFDPVVAHIGNIVIGLAWVRELGTFVHRDYVSRIRNGCTFHALYSASDNNNNFKIKWFSCQACIIKKGKTTRSCSINNLTLFLQN